MVRPPAHAEGVRPHPLLRLVEPLGDELLLADGADRVGVVAVVRDGDVLDLGLRRRGRAGRRGQRGPRAAVGPAGPVGVGVVVQVDRLAGFDPILIMNG